MQKLSPRVRFLLLNSLKGMLWLLLLLAVYFVVREFVEKNPQSWIDHFYSKPLIIYLIYFVSEFLFGIIPPELFMIWALHKGSMLHYIFNLASFAAVSYLLGYSTFLIGQVFFKKDTFRKIKSKYFRNVWPQFRRYGLFLIIVAAITPVPWSATCLIVGAAGYPSKRFLLFALFRLLRFAVYGTIIFQTQFI